MNSISQIFSFILIGVLAISQYSCKRYEIPEEMFGEWETDSITITVRYKEKGDGFKFISDNATVSIKINHDKTVSGFIGDAVFDKGIIRKNPGSPKITGVAHIIECGSVGEIFHSDPVKNKEIEIWIYPFSEKIEAELRLTEGLAVFPMAHLVMKKK